MRGAARPVLACPSHQSSMWRQSASIVLLLLAALLTGCGGSVRSGRVVGGIIFEGNAQTNQPAAAYQSGVVTVRNATGAVVASKRVTAGRRFGFVLPDGRYELRTELGCTTSVDVIGTRTSSANIVCVFHGGAP